MSQKVYIPEYVHELIVKELEALPVDFYGAENVEYVVQNSVHRNVGRNQMVIYSLSPELAQEIFEFLSEIILTQEVNGHTLSTCEKVLDKFKVVMEAPEEEVTEPFSMTFEELEEKKERQKKKKSPGKKAGGHIPAVWRDWDDEKLRDHLLQNVYISDAAWASVSETRLKGEKRAEFIVRIFAEREALNAR